MFQIIIEAKPNSSQNKIEKISANIYRVWLTAPAKAGQANAQLIKLLADYFQVSKSQVEIKRGQTAKIKVVIIYG